MRFVAREQLATTSSAFDVSIITSLVSGWVGFPGPQESGRPMRRQGHRSVGGGKPPRAELTAASRRA
jgi:hypothetical protein